MLYFYTLVKDLKWKTKATCINTTSLFDWGSLQTCQYGEFILVLHIYKLKYRGKHDFLLHLLQDKEMPQM